MDLSNFKIGCWYKSNSGAKNEGKYYYLKVLRINSSDVAGDGLLPYKSDKSEQFQENYFWNSRDTLEQALEIGPLDDISEIIEYLPDNHIGKVEIKKLIDYTYLIEILNKIT